MQIHRRRSAVQIVQSLCFLNPKFQASSHLLWLYSLGCVGPSWKTQRQVSCEVAHMVETLRKTGDIYIMGRCRQGMTKQQMSRLFLVLSGHTVISYKLWTGTKQIVVLKLKSFNKCTPHSMILINARTFIRDLTVMSIYARKQKIYNILMPL